MSTPIIEIIRDLSIASQSHVIKRNMVDEEPLKVLSKILQKHQNGLRKVQKEKIRVFMENLIMDFFLQMVLELKKMQMKQ